MTYLTVAVTLLLGGILALTPQLSRATVPLGVSVPRAHAADPAVRAGVHRFRLGVAAATVAASVVAASAGALAPDRDAAAVGGMLAAAAPLLLLVGALLALQAGRAVIARAKRDGGWYDGVPVRVGAEVIRPDGDGARTAAVPWLPFAAAATVIAVGVCLELALYDRFPTRIPQHVGPGGVTRWADKSVPAVLGPSLVAAVVVAAMWGLAWFTTRAPVRRLPDGAPAAAAARATAARRITLWVLGAAAVLVSLQLTATGLLLAAAAPAGTIEAVSGIGAVVIVGAIGVMVAVSVRTLRRTPAPGDTGPDSPTTMPAGSSACCTSPPAIRRSWCRNGWASATP
ncbi:hypothetical protein [Tsukamurella soli]|uniref:hypothetical protein n=1 Tax=Tsukamurella soli TaxID=644556 RepID=UPI003606E79F